MLTQEQVLEAVKTNSTNYDRDGCKFIDSRDFMRLTDFFPVDQWAHFGFAPKECVEIAPPKPWDLESISEQFVADLNFAWEKASDERGISAELMFEVVMMWMWILEDHESGELPYENYGKASLRAIAEKYSVELVGE